MKVKNVNYVLMFQRGEATINRYYH